MLGVNIGTMLEETLGGLASPAMKEAILDDIADGARARWINLARRHLKSSKQDYIRGVQGVMAEPGVRVITLVGWLANRVEQGLDAYDLRKTILNNPNSRIRRPSMRRIKGSRSGAAEFTGHWFARVPFRHKTPGSGYGGGSPMDKSMIGGAEGKVGAGAAVAIGTAIYAKAKKLKATVKPGPGKQTKWGGRLDTKGMGVPLLKKHHAGDIFAGMVRSRHTYKKSTQTQYMTWRTISTRNPNGWRHPGIEAHGLANQVEDWIVANAPRIIKRAVRAAMSGK